MAPTLRIAVIQFLPENLALEANFLKAASKIREAAKQGAELAVVPEYHLTGWLPDHPDFRKVCIESAPYLAKYQGLARELGIHIVPGTIVEPLEKEGSSEVELHNIAYFLEAGTGKILGQYQKKNLWHPERQILTPGKHTAHQAFNVPLPNGGGTIRVGLLICWDVTFPEGFRELVADGAQLIVASAFWEIDTREETIRAVNTISEEIFLSNLMVTRAFENTCAVALANAFGESQVTMPLLGSLGKSKKGEEDIVISEVDFKVLEIAENWYKIRADMQGEEWHYSCRTRGKN